MPDATTYSAKKAKTTSTGPLLYSELDISNLTVDATLMGSNETRFATVKYNDARMVYQMASVGEAMSPPGPVRSTRVARAPHLKPAAYVPATCTAAALSRWARSLS